MRQIDGAAGARPDAWNYATGKAAVIQLTRCTAAELAQFGIRVNAICPGVIITEIFANYVAVSGIAADNVRAMVTANAPDLQPLKRAGLPEDIARICLYLASLWMVASPWAIVMVGIRS